MQAATQFAAVRVLRRAFASSSTEHPEVLRTTFAEQPGKYVEASRLLRCRANCHSRYGSYPFACRASARRFFYAGEPAAKREVQEAWPTKAEEG